MKKNVKETFNLTEGIEKTQKQTKNLVLNFLWKTYQ